MTEKQGADWQREGRKRRAVTETEHSQQPDLLSPRGEDGLLEGPVHGVRAARGGPLPCPGRVLSRAVSPMNVAATEA